MSDFNQQSLQPYIIVVIVGVFIGFLRPFGMDSLPFHLTILYWVLVCFAGYLLYRPFIEFGERFLAKYCSSRIVRTAISVVVASAVFSLIVPMITWGIFSYETDYRTQYFSIFAKALVIGSALTLVGYVQEYVKMQQDRLAENERKTEEIHEEIAQQEAIEQQAFIDLLPIEKRGKLVCLEMSDHYVKVHTDKGHHMLLMRFKDALDRLQNVDGIQTHRSWWVATNQITATTKEGRKQMLVMSNQIKVPVSRTYADAVKAANII